MNDDPPNSRWENRKWVPARTGKNAKQDTGELPPLSMDQGILVGITEIGDLDQALKLAADYVTAEFEAAHGDRVKELETEVAYVRSRLVVETAAQHAIDKELTVEPGQIPAAFEHGSVGGPSEPWATVPPSRWQLRDQLTSVLSMIGIAGLTAASYVGIEATLAEAQLSIFENNRYLSSALAILPAAGGLALKQLSNVFTDPSHRDRFRKGICIAGVVALFAWIPMFSGLFSGLSGIFDPFAEPKHLLGWAFNSGHIFSEILIAAALYTHLDAVMARYAAPSEKIDNPARPPLERAKDKQTKPVEVLTARLAHAEGPLARLYGLRNKAHILVETAIRQRMNETPRDGLL